jgi:hypothetical protein
VLHRVAQDGITTMQSADSISSAKSSLKWQEEAAVGEPDHLIKLKEPIEPASMLEISAIRADLIAFRESTTHAAPATREPLEKAVAEGYGTDVKSCKYYRLCCNGWTS